MEKRMDELSRFDMLSYRGKLYWIRDILRISDVFVVRVIAARDRQEDVIIGHESYRLNVVSQVRPLIAGKIQTDEV